MHSTLWCAKICCVAGVPNETEEQLNDYLIIGLCFGLLGLIYVVTIIAYFMVKRHRANRKQEGTARNSLCPPNLKFDEECRFSQRVIAPQQNLQDEPRFLSFMPSSTGGAKTVDSQQQVNEVRYQENPNTSSCNDSVSENTGEFS